MASNFLQFNFSIITNRYKITFSKFILTESAARRGHLTILTIHNCKFSHQVLCVKNCTFFSLYLYFEKHSCNNSIFEKH